MWLLLALIFLPNLSSAFPDQIRHGYTSCTTCHVSPSGGGLMTDYGRSLSKELMSTSGYKNEEQVLHGLMDFKKPKALEHIVLGGDARYISRRQKTDTSKIDEGFWMQTQLRAGLIFEKIKIILSLGTIENPRESDQIRWISPEYYALLTPTPQFSIRAGRFEPQYGLRLPDHNLWIKSEVGFVPWLQRDTLEYISESESQIFTLSGFQSISKVNFAQQTTGYAASFYQILGEKQRVGVSAMNAEGQGTRSKSFTLHSTLSYSDHFYTHLEATRVWNTGITKDVSFMRTGYEVYKGIVPFAQFQSNVDRAQVGNGNIKYGGGLQWLPRPHWEIFFNIEKQQSKLQSSTENYVLLHYYL